METFAKKQRINTQNELYDVSNARIVKFAKNFEENDNFMLFEIPENVLRSIRNGGELEILGENRCHAILCTDDMTFTVKKVETSNQVYLVSPRADAQKWNQIETKCNHFYEVFFVSITSAL